MEFEVFPKMGVGSLQFGMTIEEVRKAMDLPFKSISKSDTGIPTDSFLENSVQVFYKQPGMCEAIEIYAPLRVLMNGVNLLGEPYSKVKSFLSELDSQLDEDNAGLISRVLGVSIYAPWHRKSPNSPTESVLAFEDGYYER
jgi:hypothetical protein